MATRLFSQNRKLRVYQKQSIKSLSALLRLFSSQNRSNQSSEDTSHPAKVKSDPAGKWLNIRAGIFGPDDDRLPLPGDIGLGHHFEAEKVEVKELRVAMETLFKEKQSPFLSVSDVLRTEHEQYLDDICQLKMKYIDLTNGAESTKSKLECRVQKCPELLKSDIQALFPNFNLKKVPLLVITLCKYTSNDMSSWSLEVEAEREELFKKFIESAQRICDELEADGYWADFIDPTSGMPHRSPYTNHTFFESDERYRHLGFCVEDLGCCKVISHRNWGTQIFVGALFTNAPFSCPELEHILRTHAVMDDDDDH